MNIYINRYCSSVVDWAPVSESPDLSFVEFLIVSSANIITFVLSSQRCWEAKEEGLTCSPVGLQCWQSAKVLNTSSYFTANKHTNVIVRLGRMGFFYIHLHLKSGDLFILKKILCNCFIHLFWNPHLVSETRRKLSSQNLLWSTAAWAFCLMLWGVNKGEKSWWAAVFLLGEQNLLKHKLMINPLHSRTHRHKNGSWHLVKGNKQRIWGGRAFHWEQIRAVM